MKMIPINKRLTVLGLLVASFAATNQGNAANLLLNPGFESGDFTSWTTVAGSNPVALTVAATDPNSGTQHVSHVDPLNGGVNNQNANSSISQTVAITAAEQGMDFSAFIWYKKVTGSAINLSLTADFDTGTDVTNTLVSIGGGYTKFEITGTVPLTATSMTFTAFLDKQGSGKPEIFLDDASFSIVPEPSTALLGVLGLTALFRRRR